MANDLLQGDLDRAQTTIARFTVNTIIGFGGMADVAADLGTPPHSEDFGQTAATHGVGSGPYLMLPFLGPSNVRDALGRVVDTFLDPLDYALDGGDSIARASVEGLDQRARFLDVSEALEKRQSTTTRRSAASSPKTEPMKSATASRNRLSIYTAKALPNNP